MSQRRVLRIDADTNLRTAVRDLERELAADIGAAPAAQAADLIARQAHDMQRELKDMRAHGRRPAALSRDLAGPDWQVHLTNRAPGWTERLRSALFE